MIPKETRTDVGVIVARFQIHNLSDAHIDLIETVINRHSKVIIFLGLSPIIGTMNNPLDFESRKQMILDKYPNVNVLYIKDINDDVLWSKRLDEQISDLLLPKQTATLYGGRDSFIEHYHGKFPVTELEPKIYLSGTELRKEISSKVKASADFRAGVIWATHNRWPSVVTTVDVIIYDDRGRLLLVRKHNEKNYRFVGGYSQPDTISFEMDARREILEEVGVEVGMMQYLTSLQVKDWRYNKEVDKIKTLLFTAKYLFGGINIKDTAEIAEARWFAPHELDASNIVEEHHELYRVYLQQKK